MVIKMHSNYKVGTYLIYDTFGICKLDKIENLSFSKGTPKRPYYVLSPLNSPSSTYYVPVTNNAQTTKLRPPMTEKEIKALLEKSRSLNIKWIENRQERNENFGKILASGISEELICLISCLYSRSSALSELGKTLSSTDKDFLVTAEKMVAEEFAFSLGILPEEVPGYINSFMKA